MEGIELVEKYAILMLGVKRNPIPSDIHIQKELFILSNAKPDVKKYFSFEKHYLGPFSRTLNNLIKAPLFVTNAFSIQENKISLRIQGLDAYSEMLTEYYDKPNFAQLLFVMRLIRDLYDRLSNQEFLFLIYETYPAYTEFSDKSDYLLKNIDVRKKIINSLHFKGAITEARRLELLEEQV